MHGRDAERRIVGDLLRRARRGRGGVLLIDGEEGIGKSRLLGGSVDEAAGLGFSLAAGAADRLGRTNPFFALQAALREPPGKLASKDRQHRLTRRTRPDRHRAGRQLTQVMHGHAKARQAIGLVRVSARTLRT